VTDAPGTQVTEGSVSSKASESCIRFSGVGKSWGETEVLHGIDLSMPSATVTALVGESGSGKSTLLQIANGLLRPDYGDVSVLGEPIDYQRLPQLRRRMGYAVQGGGLFPHMTVFDNISLVARLEGWSGTKMADRVDELFALFSLQSDLSDRYPHELSGGQQQRVSLCRAIMLAPSLLLLDEPFSALDPITRASIHEDFNALRGATDSTVLVTHDMAEAIRLADYLVVLREGRVVQSGEVSDVRSAPIDDYVSHLFEVLA